MPTLFTNIRISPTVDPASGGMPFVAQAPHPSFALVGLLIRAGDWIDQVTPIYAELLDDGSIGPEQYGRSYGGYGGGQPHELRVEPGYVVTGIQTRSGNFLDGVRLHQTAWDGSLVTGESSWTRWIMGAMRGGVERPERFAEPRGHAVVVGISGRSGGYVDNLSIVSAEIHRVAATAVGTRSVSQAAAR